ncbi:MAG: ATP-binding protein [Clostridium sp.]|nr:ATP-binding protein [Clostridium sp.]
MISRFFNDSKDKGFLKYSDNNYVYAFRKTPFGTDIVFQECNSYNSYLNKLIVEFIIIGVISLVILFALSVIIARKSIKPVEAAYNSQKRFIGDASHELKTPLAVIKTNIDVLKANENDTIKNQEKWFNYISFQLEEIKQRMCISVQNTGETIPKEDIDKIFERFYRVDKSRERERGGYGLGLSIAKSIVTRYKGKIYVQSENNLTKFSVELPIK